MSEHVEAVHRSIVLKGRTITLTRLGGPSRTIKAVFHQFRIAELVPPLQQGDKKMFVSAISLEGWPLPVMKNDVVTTDAEEYTVLDSEPVQYKGEVAKYRVTVRGGFIG